MQRTTEIDLTGTFQVLKDLVDVALAANSEAPWMDVGFDLTIFSPRTNASGTRVQVTSDFVNEVPQDEILTEASQVYQAGGSIHNSVSLLDKMVRIVDAADAATTGTAVITYEWA